MNRNKLMSRSEFLRNGLKSLLGYAVDAFEQTVEKKAGKAVIPVHRPPGAIDELSFLSKCTRCNLCIEACPHDAIVTAEAKYGLATGTPIIKPFKVPCYLCQDYPCIEACSEDALVPVENVKMGTAHLIHNKCLAYNGQICDYCFDRCPLKGKAIVVDERKPRVIEENCTGCGICEYFCPAPGNAIVVLPKRN